MSTSLIDLQVPGLGESVTEARIANWVKTDGERVSPDEVVAELETDKATVELPAGANGVLRIVKTQGQTVNIGEVIARIEQGESFAKPAAKPPAASPAATTPAAPVTSIAAAAVSSTPPATEKTLAPA